MRPLTWLLRGSILVFVVIAYLLVTRVFGQESDALGREFHLTLAGDAIIVTPAMVRERDTRFMDVVKAIRRGDAAVVNVEGTFAGHDAYRSFDTGSTRIALDPERLKDMQWMGFNLFSAANNHSLDYGIRGLLDTTEVFRQRGALYAGIGETLEQARVPAYLTTANGRVALLSCASTFSDEASAGSSRSDSRGRPGLSPLHFESRYRVDPTAFKTLSKLKDQLRLGGGSQVSPQTLTLSFDSTQSGRFNGVKPVTFELSNRPGVSTTPDPQDLAELSNSIRETRIMADYTVAYIHAHEAAPGSNEVPAQFLVEFAHAAIDAGADVFAGAGPHLLRGIEIYKGKPIFYSLGNFIQEVDLVLPKAQAVEAYDRNDPSSRNREGGRGQSKTWESVVAEVVFRNGNPAEIILTPITLGFSEKQQDRGYPKLATSESATEILERLQKLSQPFGTRMTIKDGVGIITVDNTASMH